MLDPDAEIIPGVGAAGITLGQSVEALLALGMEDDIETRIANRVLTFGPVRAYDGETGVITGICVGPGYRGRVAGVIGIGSRLSEIVALFGPVEYIMAGEYQIDKGTPWEQNDWTFIVEKGSPDMGEPGWEDARVETICVFEA